METRKVKKITQKTYRRNDFKRVPCRIHRRNNMTNPKDGFAENGFDLVILVITSLRSGMAILRKTQNTRFYNRIMEKTVKVNPCL